jgi:hypothetical protein
VGTPAWSNPLTMSPREFCLTAKEMYFSLITEDTRVFDYFEKFDFSSLIKTYDDCDFMREQNGKL